MRRSRRDDRPRPLRQCLGRSSAEAPPAPLERTSSPRSGWPLARGGVVDYPRESSLRSTCRKGKASQERRWTHCRASRSRPAGLTRRDCRHRAPGALAARARRPFPRHGARPGLHQRGAARVRGTAIEAGAKALVFLAADRPVHVVLPGARRVDNARLRAVFGTRTLRFATHAELLALTGCVPGAVPPFGNLFGLPVLVDEALAAREEIAFSAGSNTMSRSSCRATTSSVSRRPACTRSRTLPAPAILIGHRGPCYPWATCIGARGHGSIGRPCRRRPDPRLTTRLWVIQGTFTLWRSSDRL